MKELMKALVLESYQTGELVEKNIPIPCIDSNQVLVRVVASGMNPIDYKIRTGLAPYAEPDLPAILGTDLAGIVEEVGEGVDQFKVGDEVYGLVGGVRGLQGSLAEYVAVDADLLAIKPKNISMKEAAAIPLVFLTAWLGLVDKAHISEGQNVLIQGGAGGVGHMAVQIAKALGANVFATVSTEKQDIVKGYGAVPIDYKLKNVEEYVQQYTLGKGFDVIYDTVGGQTLDDSLLAIRPYGHVLSCYAFGTHNLAPSSLRCATISGIYVLLPLISGVDRAHFGDILKEATKLVEQDKVRPLVDKRTYRLAETLKAHHDQEDGNVLGKLVIDIH